MSGWVGVEKGSVLVWASRLDGGVWVARPTGVEPGEVD